MTDIGSRPVTVAQLVVAIMGELLVFVAWIVIDRIGNEKRVTQIEERLSAIYLRLPTLRDGESQQDERLTAIEHELIRLKTESLAPHAAKGK